MPCAGVETVDDDADKLLSADVDLACDGCSGMVAGFVENPPGSSRRARFLGLMSVFRHKVQFLGDQIKR